MVSFCTWMKNNQDHINFVSKLSTEKNWKRDGDLRSPTFPLIKMTDDSSAPVMMSFDMLVYIRKKPRSYSNGLTNPRKGFQLLQGYPW